MPLPPVATNTPTGPRVTALNDPLNLLSVTSAADGSTSFSERSAAEKATGHASARQQHASEASRPSSHSGSERPTPNVAGSATPEAVYATPMGSVTSAFAPALGAAGSKPATTRALPHAVDSRGSILSDAVQSAMGQGPPHVASADGAPPSNDASSRLLARVADSAGGSVELAYQKQPTQDGSANSLASSALQLVPGTGQSSPSAAGAVAPRLGVQPASNSNDQHSTGQLPLVVCGPERDAASIQARMRQEFLAMPESVRKRVAALLRMHVLNSVREKVEAGHLDFINEIRPLTCLFLGFPSLLEPRDDVAHQDQIDCVQFAYTSVQAVMRNWDGSFLQFRADEKGFVGICCFGLPGHTHEDNTARGIYAALELQKVRACPCTTI